jgi:hypothetical protein
LRIAFENRLCPFMIVYELILSEPIPRVRSWITCGTGVFRCPFCIVHPQAFPTHPLTLCLHRLHSIVTFPEFEYSTIDSVCVRYCVLCCVLCVWPSCFARTLQRPSLHTEHSVLCMCVRLNCTMYSVCCVCMLVYVCVFVF